MNGLVGIQFFIEAFEYFFVKWIGWVAPEQFFAMPSGFFELAAIDGLMHFMLDGSIAAAVSIATADGVGRYLQIAFDDRLIFQLKANADDEHRLILPDDPVFGTFAKDPHDLLIQITTQVIHQLDLRRSPLGRDRYADVQLTNFTVVSR